ncbi:hypothetical protein P4H54_27595, partial [Paenibacillus graminis]|nr:hypothetical protein [Paenibacillus graminis]
PSALSSGGGTPGLFSAVGASTGLPAGDADSIEPFADGGGNPGDGGAVRWINREDMANYAFPNVFLKLLNRYFDEQNG